MRRALTILVGLVVVTGCGPSGHVVTGDPPREPYSGPMHLPVDHGDEASVLERSGAAGRALECGTEPYGGGSGDYDSGLATTQGSAESALENYFSEEFFAQLPRDGYRVEREDRGRVLFSYDVHGDTKVAFIAADSIRDFNDDEGWGIEAWAECDPAELPASVTDELGIQVWHDASGNRIPVAKIQSYPGSEHCDWEDITFLTLTTKNGGRQYLRDTTGELRDLLATKFNADAKVPKQATDTGFERAGRRLWLNPDGTAAYLVDKSNPENVEQWPAANEPVACA
jgi:hypothetical protein